MYFHLNHRQGNRNKVQKSLPSVSSRYPNAHLPSGYVLIAYFLPLWKLLCGPTIDFICVFLKAHLETASSCFGWFLINTIIPHNERNLHYIITVSFSVNKTLKHKYQALNTQFSFQVELNSFDHLFVFCDFLWLFSGEGPLILHKFFSILSASTFNMFI